jgi:hypothetical protein
MVLSQILPGTGRGTGRRPGEGLGERLLFRANPSTTLRVVPLPVPGRIAQ